MAPIGAPLRSNGTATTARTVASASCLGSDQDQRARPASAPRRAARIARPNVRRRVRPAVEIAARSSSALRYRDRCARKCSISPSSSARLRLICVAERRALARQSDRTPAVDRRARPTSPSARRWSRPDARSARRIRCCAASSAVRQRVPRPARPHVPVPRRALPATPR